MPHNDKTAADLFNEVGPLLYGEDWLDHLAPALGVNRETLRNVRRGSMTHAAEGMAERLMGIAETRARETARARDAVAAWLKARRPAPAARAPRTAPAKRRTPRSA